MISEVPSIALTEALTHRNTFIEIDELTSYKRVTAQLHARGVILRDEIEGSRIKIKKQQLCKANDFLVAEIDAKVGGFGIVPNDLEGAIVSSHYFLFEIDAAKLNPRYLDFVAKTDHFQRQISARGTTNYASIKPSDVLNLRIPCPTLDEQERAVAAIEKLTQLISQVKRKRTEFGNLQVFWDALLTKAFSGKLTLQNARDKPTQLLQNSTYKLEANSKWRPLDKLEDLASLQELPEDWGWTSIGTISKTINYGYTASAIEDRTDTKLLRISDIQNESVDWTSVPYCIIDRDKKQKYILADGDLVFARTGGTVGKSFLIQGTIPEAVFASYLIRIRLNNKVDPKYVYYFFQSRSYWNQIRKGKTATGQPNVNARTLSQIRMPLPPLSEQRYIVSKIELLKERTEKIKKLQSYIETEINELVPSILQKALYHARGKSRSGRYNQTQLETY